MPSGHVLSDIKQIFWGYFCFISPLIYLYLWKHLNSQHHLNSCLAETSMAGCGAVYTKVWVCSDYPTRMWLKSDCPTGSNSFCVVPDKDLQYLLPVLKVLLAYSFFFVEFDLLWLCSSTVLHYLFCSNTRKDKLECNQRYQCI